MVDVPIRLHVWILRRVVMNETQKTQETETPPLTAKDLGAASERTHGDAFNWPFYEQGIPPFNHRCPSC